MDRWQEPTLKFGPVGWGLETENEHFWLYWRGRSTSMKKTTFGNSVKKNYRIQKFEGRMYAMSRKDGFGCGTLLGAQKSMVETCFTSMLSVRPHDENSCGDERTTMTKMAVETMNWWWRAWLSAKNKYDDKYGCQWTTDQANLTINEKGNIDDSG